MRIAALALLAVVGTGAGCARRSLRADDGGGGGSIGFDAAVPPTDAAAPPADAPVPPTDAPVPPADAPVRPIDAAVPTADANCGQSSIGGNLVPTEILVVLDRSISGDQASWRSVIAAVAGQITANMTRIDWGLYTFPKDGPACGPATVTTTIDVPITSDPSSHVIAHIAAAGVAGNGTPTAAAIGVGAAYLRTLADPSPKFMMLVSDGAPSCAGTIGALSEDAVQAQTDAVAAIAAAAAEGFRTIVVAPSTTTAPADVGALNALADAGGLPRGNGDIRFLTESTLPDLFSPVSVGSCVVPLQSAPPAPDNVTVIFNGDSVPRDTSHMNGGWDYTDPETHRNIAFYGNWCVSLLESRSIQIDVYFGCPNSD